MHPEYTVRESTRAKQVRFRVSASDGLVVVIPSCFDRRRIPELIAEKRGWIERALRQVESHCAAMGPPDARPETIDLRAIGRSWRLEWIDAAGSKASVDPTGLDGLQIAVPSGDPDAWRPALRRWLIGRGREHLSPWAERLAAQLGVSFERVSIRCQKTRWGSYATKTRTVSLNAQLLFLPGYLARFVLLHELCHIRYPNHSPAFWNLVSSHEPDTDRLRVELRAAWRYVPTWVARPG